MTIHPAIGCVLFSSMAVLAFLFFGDVLGLIKGHPDGVSWWLAICVVLIIADRVRRTK